MKRTLLTTLALMLLSCAAYAQGTVAFKLTPPGGKLKLAEVFTVKAEATLPPGYSLRPDTASADSGSFELLSFTRTGAGEEGGQKKEVFEIRAQAFALGASTFPAITWNLVGGGSAQQVNSPAFQLEILPLFETKPGEGIRDIYPPVSFIPWYWLALGAAAAAAAARWLYRRFRPLDAAAIAAAAWKDSRTAYQRARDRLDRLAAGPLAGSGRLKEFYIGLTSILRLYLKDEFSIDAGLMTTADLARELKRTGADLKTNLRTRELLKKADLVKFARLRPEDAAADTEDLKYLLIEFTRAAEKAREPQAAAPSAAAAGAVTGAGAVKK